VLSHGRWPHGTDWLLEVTAETYIPLLNALFSLVDEGCSPKITVSLTPVLMEQLADKSFALEFAAYAKMRAAAAQANKKEFNALHDKPMADLADYWHGYYSSVYSDFKKRYKGSLLKAFAALQDAGHIEVMTSSATHGYSPLLSQDESINAQVKQGVMTYKQYFNRQPLGYWLPECAYRPGYQWSAPLQPKSHQVQPYSRKGVEEFLRENGLQYFIVESHLLQGGETHGVYIDRFGALQKLWKQFSDEQQDTDPVKTPYAFYMLEPAKEDEEPIFVFIRDHVTGRQVWSRSGGYPGDPSYLEFHKKHSPGGLRYWRVTGPNVDLGQKMIYEPETAARMTEEHAKHFVEVAKRTLLDHEAQHGKPGVICAPYDTELYGHWWFEGVSWLKNVLRTIDKDPEIRTATCSQYLSENMPAATISLPEGSWGEGGFHYMWLNETTDWTWSYVYEAELEMKSLLEKYGKNKTILPILKQAARELFLLQSSDWQFCISTKTSKDYGELRLTGHFKNFQRLAALIKKIGDGGEADEAEWTAYKICEERNSLFKDIDPNWFASIPGSAKKAE
jgi:1,4-alpha-glucan branching enzyme